MGLDAPFALIAVPDDLKLVAMAFGLIKLKELVPAFLLELSLLRLDPFLVAGRFLLIGTAFISYAGLFSSMFS